MEGQYFGGMLMEKGKIVLGPSVNGSCRFEESCMSGNETLVESVLQDSSSVQKEKHQATLDADLATASKMYQIGRYRDALSRCREV